MPNHASAALQGSVKITTCLFEGVRPHERRTFCPPNKVPFKTLIASSAQLLMQVRHNISTAKTRKYLVHFRNKIIQLSYFYLSENWTNPHLLPDGIFTCTSSPYWLKTCLK
jgi:hypothetical protein